MISPAYTIQIKTTFRRVRRSDSSVHSDSGSAGFPTLGWTLARMPEEVSIDRASAIACGKVNGDVLQITFSVPSHSRVLIEH
jgi:hypothetical protein